MIKKYALLLLLISAFPVAAQPFIAWPTIETQIQLQSTALPLGTGCYAAFKLLPYSRIAAVSAMTAGSLWGLFNNKKFKTKSISVLPFKNGGL